MTTPTPGYRTVTVDEARKADLLTIDRWAFPSGLPDGAFAALPVPLSWDRTRGVRSGSGDLVAVHSSYPFQGLPVPGGTVDAAGLTWVGVHPGHRRRGILRTMITDHLERTSARGEAVSVLTASEPSIYGRFGYGSACPALRLTVPRGAALRDVPGAQDVHLEIETLDVARHAPTIRALHGRVGRPGWATRTTTALEASFLHDSEHTRDGHEPLRVVTASLDGTPTGYALFRRRLRWEDTAASGTVSVVEAVARDAATARALWGALLDMDLMSGTEVGLLPVDDVLTHLLVDLRAAAPRLKDHVWVRLVDLPAALRARRYAAPVHVVLEVADAMVPANAGRWRLQGGPDHAEVTRTDADPDLVLDVRELGTVYLGGVSTAALHAAGLVREVTAGAVARAAVAFGWPTAPGCSWVF
ncbi:GNAT family N-acetyltransferase [Cellulomonas bogoriensis]|uniref:Acetyltransferase n=1 Tax=Cellulomonas bogoriensis 69B4 = DSM 16987 TaxID=1386082 RepID=A0A0A0C1D3_9CELL|nr:GNAT family N-acetyltransferase [Cellulomonas bogoriensis]KGM13727.1 acetyltransferase [Cellulomonas bogoriensis 69B4 = DSM 16987]